MNPAGFALLCFAIAGAILALMWIVHRKRRRIERADALYEQAKWGGLH